MKKCSHQKFLWANAVFHDFSNVHFGGQYYCGALFWADWQGWARFGGSDGSMCDIYWGLTHFRGIAGIAQFYVRITKKTQRIGARIDLSGWLTQGCTYPYQDWAFYNIYRFHLRVWKDYVKLLGYIHPQANWMRLIDIGCFHWVWLGLVGVGERFISPPIC